MEIERSFSFKIFFILLGIIFIPLIISFLYILKIKTQVNPTENITVFLLVSLLALVLAIIGALSISKPLYNRISKYNEIARKIAGGMFELRLPIDCDDELGKLGRFFNMLTKEHHEIKKKGVGEKLFEREKIQAILKNIGDGVIVTDNSNQIELVNSVAEKWFGISQQESPKFHIEDIIQDEQLWELIEKVKHGENQNDEKVEILIKPANLNKEMVLQAIATKVISENRKLYGVATAFRDLTKEKEIDRKKTEVVSMVSHELRSPLTSIAGFSELLLDENLTREKARDYANIILKESRRLNDLINKYLDISRIESGKSEVHRTLLNIEDVIRSVIDMNSFIAESKGIDVEIRIPEKISNVFADRQMIGEVILNLFSNAVKYSPSNTRITIVVEDNDKEQIIKVMDQGYGIPEKALNRIFDKFYRVTENENVQEEEGSGLGLALVKEIINKHNGRIWAESQLNRGSTFFITLPKTNTEDFDKASVDDMIMA